MNFQRNFKMYIKQKSTIIALVFFLLSSILFSLSFVPNIKINKGVLSNFKTYDITNVTSNINGVTYAYNDKYLFYSQNKEVKSTLNDFMNFKNYDSAYGELELPNYNFIRIDKDFSKIDNHYSPKIVDVQGFNDNIGGSDGETYILLNNGYLYLISNRSEKVELILKDVAQIKLVNNPFTNQNIVVMLDFDGYLYLFYLQKDGQNQTSIHKIKPFNDKLVNSISISSNETLNDFHYLYHNLINGTFNMEFLVVNNGKCKKIEKTFSKENIILEDENLTYPIYLHSSSSDSSSKEFENFFNTNKIVRNFNGLYSLYDNKVSKIEPIYTENPKKPDILDIKIIEIPCENKINDIYCCGGETCIAQTDNGLYYVGSLKYFNDTYDNFLPLGVKNGLIYGNRYSVILYKNKRFYLYNKDHLKFEPMYQNYLIIYLMRYLSLFVTIMIILYLIIAFVEANGRYNRYFKDHKDDDKHE